MSIEPKTGVLRSAREAEWGGPIGEQWANALSELVDNAFGAHRGNATAVNIGVDAKRKLVWVWDNGEGVVDLEAPFTLGSRDEYARIDDEDLGQYGVGGTNACLWMGSQLELRTLRPTGPKRFGWALADWQEIIDTDDWEAFRQQWRRASKVDVGYDALWKSRRGSLFLISGVDKIPHNPGKMWELVRGLLSRTYTPALLAGRTITWHQWDSEGFKPEDLRPWRPVLESEKVVPISFTLRGKLYEASLNYGVNDDLPLRDVGISVDYSFRQIMHTKDFFGEYGSRVSGLYGRLVLGPAFKGSLSRHKQQIKIDQMEMLHAHVYAALESVLEDRADQANELRINRILDAIAGDVEKTLRRRVHEDENGDTEATFGGGWGDDPEPVEDGARVHEGRGYLDEEAEEAKTTEPRGAMVKIIPSSNVEMDGLLAVCWPQDSDPQLVVRINKDHDEMRKALDRDPANIVALNFAVREAIGQGLAGKAHLVKRYIPDFFKDAQLSEYFGKPEFGHALSSFLAWGEVKK